MSLQTNQKKKILALLYSGEINTPQQPSRKNYLVFLLYKHKAKKKSRVYPVWTMASESRPKSRYELWTANNKLTMLFKVIAA